MIVVIADDFTGAAEIGGIGLRYGLSVVIETEAVLKTNADLLIIATDTRSLTKEEASELVEKTTQKVMEVKPDFIYKKVDSVLRGHVLDELLAQMKVTAKNRSIVVAANPTFQKTIRKGIYYIKDIPLHRTFFSNDPEYPITSSYVDFIVGKGKVFSNLGAGDDLPAKGLILGDVTCIEDLKKWATRIDDNTLPAGGSGFFREIINNRKGGPGIPISQHIPYGQNALYIMGSTFPKQYSLEAKISKSGHLLSNMSEELYNNPVLDSPYLDKWADEISLAIYNHKKVIVAIPHNGVIVSEYTHKIRKVIGILVKKVFTRIRVDELILEGGATTWAILKALNINELIPFHEFETGVIRMKVKGKPGLHVITKPGSYLWPDKIWYLNENGQANPVTKKEEVR